LIFPAQQTKKQLLIFYWYKPGEKGMLREQQGHESRRPANSKVRRFAGLPVLSDG